MIGQDEISIVDSRKAIDNPINEVQFELLRPPGTKERPSKKKTLAETLEQSNTALHSPWLKQKCDDDAKIRNEKNYDLKIENLKPWLSDVLGDR